MSIKKADTWMPFYIADYLRKTMHLTRDQHGGYFLLLMACWDRGGRLPNDDNQLAGIAKASPAEWRKLAPVLRPFFEIDGEHLIHGRVIEEHQKAAKLSEARRQSGLQGGRPRKQTESKEKPIGFTDTKQTGLQTETPACVALPSPSDYEPNGSTSEVSDANASSVVGKPSDDIPEAVALWNELAGRLGLPKAKMIDKARRAALKARLSEGGLEAWREALAAVERSPHCRGENDRAWRADLDFVCQPKSWRRLLEGSYGGADPAAAAPMPKFTGPADLRAAVAAECGEDFCAAYLDPCQWQDVPSRTLIPRTRVAADKLRREAGAVLGDVQIEERAA